MKRDMQFQEDALAVGAPPRRETAQPAGVAPGRVCRGRAGGSSGGRFAKVAPSNALSALTAREREVLTLWHAGMNYAEIAERTTQPMDSVGLLLQRARERLVMAADLLEGATP